ncbi:hypothetical protein CspeluHIS016_0107790 [Cutaneotrichosporon spelunceum]|uniref:Nucleotide-diphospho-sugar transferase n=1 Tax=Cutaneotrichosporon spelunceum TaxID=1672016 RepID=A0AAD3TNM8_9TREE|nr:hypothetical protein CspeluHIS016_0107790 [Cutaneotrichosporon spelunceum]
MSGSVPARSRRRTLSPRPRLCLSFRTSRLSISPSVDPTPLFKVQFLIGLVNMAALLDNPSAAADPTLPDAFVTLLTDSSYLPGALALLHALHELHPAPRNFKIACLVTPETIQAATIGALRNAGYDVVIGVEPIASGQRGKTGLHLMGRPDLDLALTKLHIFRLGYMFKTIFYMDADTLPIRPISHLFQSTAPHTLSACPDIGWPDCFNSGVMVIRPRLSDFENLRQLTTADASGGNGSFDGADQGLLNHYFSEEGAGGPWNRLPFTYNVTPSAAYQYMPAFKHFAHKINVIHFIGPRKPWGRLPTRPAGVGMRQNRETPMGYEQLIDRWFDVYDRNVRPTAIHEPNIAKRFIVPENIAVWNLPRDGHGDLANERDARFITVPGEYTSIPLDGRYDLMAPQLIPGPALEYPQLAWDASRDPPPKDSQPEMAIAVDNFYAPAWDEPTRSQGAYYEEHHDRFAMPTLPSNVLKNDWYGEFTRTVPDPKKGGSAFPWEGKGSAPRVEASRKFPQQRPPTPPPFMTTKANKPSADVLPPTTVSSAMPISTPKERDPPVTEPKPAPSFKEAMADYTNAWDEDISIGRYARRLTDLGIVSKRRNTGMHTVPPTPRRSARHMPAEPLQDVNDLSSAKNPHRRPSYQDKGTQTDRPSQNDAIVQASPETSPVSENAPSPARTMFSVATTPVTPYGEQEPLRPSATASYFPVKPIKRAAKKQTTPRGRVWDPQTDIDLMRRHQALAQFGR